MCRVIGIAILATCFIAGLILLVTGNLYSYLEMPVGTPTNSWQVTVVELDLNLLIAAPLALAFVLGLLCTLLPRRRHPA
jgi:hypothetical protein